MGAMVLMAVVSADVVAVLSLVLDSVTVKEYLEVEVEDEIEVEVEVLALVEVPGFGMTLSDTVAPQSDSGVPFGQHALSVQ